MINGHFAEASHTAAFPGIALFGFEELTRPKVPVEPQWTGRGLAPWQLRRIADHVRSNLDRSIPLSELAQIARLSRFHFCTAFRLATGLTPGEWMTEARIRRAAELLSEFELSITEIALEVGYETPSSFTARFRQCMGMTPSEYRRSI